MTARAITDFVATLDRERDEAFREHLREEHYYKLIADYTTASLERLAGQYANPKFRDLYCEICERYAESVGTEEES